ncbi:zinc ribbon domain-containing protein [Methanobrevibacter sp.]|uniref:zinc ribbon domain-containing protein n=1 Tax=Methanobrevibacter sp. TaxID=66852 RepID=UPI00389106E0
MVKCPRCGYENASSSVYCDNCSYLLQNSQAKTTTRNVKNGAWAVGMAKKIILVLGIIVVAFLLFSFINNHFQPTSDESLNIVADDGTQHQSSTYPYKAVINYNGNWYAKMGDPNYMIEETGHGMVTYSLDCAAWDDVEIEAEKYDGEGELKIQLLRNGKVVAENSTTEELSSVSIAYDS